MKKVIYIFYGNGDSFNMIFIRSSRPEVFCKKNVLRNFIKFTGKHLRQSLLIKKVYKFIEKETLAQLFWQDSGADSGFPVNFVKFLRTTFLTKNLWWLLLFYHNNSPKIHKDHLYCKLFFTSKYFLSGNKHCFYFQLSSLQKYFFKATILGQIFRTKWRNPVKLDRTRKV